MATVYEMNSDAAELRQRIERFHAVREGILQQVRQVIVGQQDVLEQILITLFVGGHCLVTGLPGTAKTLMVRTIADALGLQFRRIQFTPDLMSSCLQPGLRISPMMCRCIRSLSRSPIVSRGISPAGNVSADPGS